MSLSQIRAARRLIRRKERDRAGLFLADGPQSVREAVAAPGVLVEVFVDSEAADRHADLLVAARAVGVEPRLVGARELARLTETVTPQGVVAVCRRVDVDLEASLGSAPRLVVCCDQVRDPGNAGTVVRCADGFGADAVIITAGSVDLYNPKTVRSTVGSLFHLPLCVDADLVTVAAAAAGLGLQVLAADGAGEVALPDLADTGDLDRPTLWLFGNEAWGLPPEHAAVADRRVRVPIYGAAESLNLGTAAAVCLYASATAQRRGPRA